MPQRMFEESLPNPRKYPHNAKFVWGPQESNEKQMEHTVDNMRQDTERWNNTQNQHPWRKSQEALFAGFHSAVAFVQNKDTARFTMLQVLRLTLQAFLWM